MDLRKFSEQNRKRCEALDGFNHALDSWSTSDWMTATVGELGEAANLVKKLNRERDGVPGNTQSKEQLECELARELADTFIYLDLMVQSMGFDLSDIVPRVFAAKSREIGYSDLEPMEKFKPSAPPPAVREVPVVRGDYITYQGGV